MGIPMISDGDKQARDGARDRDGDAGDGACPDPRRRALLVGGTAAAALALCRGDQPEDEEREPPRIIWIGHL